LIRGCDQLLNFLRHLGLTVDGLTARCLVE
jgi:hypothetical protein